MILKKNGMMRFGMIGIVLAMIGCTSRDELPITAKDLESRVKAGGMVRVSELIKSSEGTVCIVYPFEPKLESNNLEASRINAYLQSSGYNSDEGNWALVVADQKDVRLAKFKTSNTMDVVDTVKIQFQERLYKLQGFELMQCAPVATAAIAKFAPDGHVTIALGQVK